jgi:4-diphosphocytidyl-2-C-methyl-D-erythritol kinase
LELRKSIPIAAGLGGGSSDAALALRLAASGTTSVTTEARARHTGADVPFFLIGGTALGEGTGVHLTALPTPDFWFVIIVPDIQIAHKTAELFRGLQPGDLSDGQRLRDITRRFEAGEWSLPEELPNPFQRQLQAYPTFAELWSTLRATAGHAALSGAGPAMYSWRSSGSAALEIAAKLRVQIPAPVLVARAIGPHSDDRELRDFMRLLEPNSG